MENYTTITYIYGLYDVKYPDIIRYIGKSNKPKERLYHHRSDYTSIENTLKINWIKSVKNNDSKIEMKILKVCPLNNFEFYEGEFIKYYSSDKLTNSDTSGQGNKGRKREIIDKGIEKISKKVYQFDLNGNYITEYKSAREAGRQLSIDHSMIIRCCSGKYKHAGGFIFKYDKDSIINQIINPNAVKKTVIEVDSMGKKINEWKSLMECSRDTGIDNGNLSRVCNGKMVHIKRRYFRYKE